MHKSQHIADHQRTTPAIDWSRPIEAVHQTGLVHAALATRHAGGERWWVTWPANATWSDARGTLDPEWHGWRIRNVQPTTPDRDPALWDRMEALVRHMAGMKVAKVYPTGVYGHEARYAFDEARSIAAKLDWLNDADLIEARKLAAEVEDFPHGSLEDLALAAIKRGRQLAGEQA